MKKFLIASSALMLMIAVIGNLDSVARGGVKKPAKQGSKSISTADSDSTKKAKKANQYQKLFIQDKSCETAKGQFLTLHKVKGKLYFEMPVQYLGREMLIASTISEASDNNLGVIGYKPRPPMHVKFIKMDSTIYLSQVNIPPLYDKSNNALSKAMGLSSLDPILSSYKIACYTPDSSAVVIETTSMFTGNYESLSPMSKGGGMLNIKGAFVAAGAALDQIKAFEDNVTIKSYLSYSVTADLMGLVLLKKDEPMTMKVTRTIMLLPEEPMQARIADARVGIFLSPRSEITAHKDMIDDYAIINRWKLEPSDSVAFAKGEAVTPKKPIIFYLDEAFPDLWKEPAKIGVLRWNKAFEKIGFKNAIEVRDFPKNDPNFDPDNLKYSCIRYVPASVANAMGPSWVDPRSGEIINASVIVFNDVAQLLNQWRFVQTSQVDPSVRGMKLPDDVMKESISYILAHEVGHCLGFMHNMAASTAYAVDSLRSSSFTQKYGTTPSIMDYARFNYVAQPEDKNVKLTPPDLGIYDEYIVKYAYKPVYEKTGTLAEWPVIRSWVDEKVGDSKFRYGKQQVIARYDPSAIEEDLGDDPIKAADYGIKNLKYILAHLDEWITDKDDPEATHREMIYENIAKQYDRYIRAVMMNIGGIYLNEVNAGTNGGPRATAVPKDKQKAALKWVVDQIKNCDWIADKSITDKFSLRVELAPIFKYYTSRELFDTYKNIVLSAEVADKNAYTPAEYFDDMYNLIWDSAIKGRNITEADRLLQRLFIEIGTDVVGKKSSLVKMDLTSANEAYAPSLEHIRTFGLDESGLTNKYFEQLRAIEDKEGNGYVAQKMAQQDLSSATGYGWQYRVNLRSIDESKTMFYTQNLRILNLLKSRVAAATGQTKAHYQSMIFLIEQSNSKN